MITLPNVLISEERLALMRIIDHDVLRVFSDMRATVERLRFPERFSAPISKERIDELYYDSCFANCSLDALRDLCSRQEISIMDRGDVAEFLSSHFKEDFVISGNLDEKFLTKPGLLEMVLLTLAKNSLYRGRAQVVELSIANASLPEKVVYETDLARGHKEFVAFEVHDSGKGFPKDFDYKKALTVCPPLNSRGFGLYFTGLAAKVLQGAVDIKSVPGDTRVTFYHPIYESVMGETQT